MSQGVGDEGRIRKSCFADKGSNRGVRLHNNGNNREQSGVSSESKWNGTKLMGKMKAGNSSMVVREETKAASANGRRNNRTCGVKHQTGRCTESERQVCQKSVKWVSSSSGNRRARSWSRSDWGSMREALEGIVGMENSRVVGSRSGSTAVGSIKLEGHCEVLGDERVIIMASKTINICHHMRRQGNERLGRNIQQVLGPINESDG